MQHYPKYDEGMTEESNATAGWYPNPEDATQMRRWDGTQWTEEVAPLRPSELVINKGNSPLRGRGCLAVIVGVFLTLLVIGLVGQSGEKASTKSSATPKPKVSTLDDKVSAHKDAIKNIWATADVMKSALNGEMNSGLFQPGCTDIMTNAMEAERLPKLGTKYADEAWVRAMRYIAKASDYCDSNNPEMEMNTIYKGQQLVQTTFPGWFSLLN